MIWKNVLNVNGLKTLVNLVLYSRSKTKMRRNKINDKISQLKKRLKKNTGLSFEEYNRKLIMRNNTNWNDIDCRCIVLLNTLVRKRVKERG